MKGAEGVADREVRRRSSSLLEGEKRKLLEARLTQKAVRRGRDPVLEQQHSRNARIDRSEKATSSEAQDSYAD